MATYTFGPLIAYDPENQNIVPNGVGLVYAVTDIGRTTPLTITDLAGVPMPGNELRSDGLGIFYEFQVADHAEVVWVSGQYTVHLYSLRGVIEQVMAALAAAQQAATAAAQAAAAAAAAQAAAETAAGGGGGGGGLNVAELEERLGGDTRNLIQRVVMSRARISETEWEPRPPSRTVLTIGTLPAPADMQDGDQFSEDAS